MGVSDQLHAPAAVASIKETDVHSVGGWLGQELALAFAEEKKIPWPCRESNPVPFTTWCSHFTDISICKYSVSVPKVHAD